MAQASDSIADVALAATRRGGSGPNIFRIALSEAAFAAVVAKGRPGTLMPAFESLLTPEEIRAIDAFVRSRDRLQ